MVSVSLYLIFIVGVEVLVYFKILLPVYDLTEKIQNPREIDYADLMSRNNTASGSKVS